MRRLLTLLLALLLALTAAQAEESALPTPSAREVWLADFHDYMHDRFSVRDIVGGAFIIALDGRVVYSQPYGHTTKNRRTEITLDTCFRIASVTKLVSAVGLMQLIETKGIPLDTPISDVLGYRVFNPAFPEEAITIRQVLSHTSSIEPVNTYHPNWEKLAVKNKYFSAKYKPGTRYAYSNLNGGLIGALIEALSGQSVNTYMQAHVFGPLGINAAYHAALLPDQSQIAQKLNKNGSISATNKAVLATFRDYNDTCDPRQNTDLTVGGLYISANGLIRIIAMLQQGGVLDGVRILKEETVQLMMQDQQLISGSSVLCESEYGLGMARVYGMPGGTWYGHQGKYLGLSSNIYFQPDTGLSVAVIANGYSSKNEDGVATIARVVMEKAQEFLP